MFGIITIALGERRYIEMAKMLALSLKQTNPQIKRAVITNVDEKEFEGLYDICIPYNTTLGIGLVNKIYLDQYTPFDETLFIDADCLAVKPLDDMIKLCRQYPFAVFGDQITSGHWNMEVSEVCKKFNVPSIPCFNGGTYYFNKSEVVTNIYNTAREIYKDYTQHGFAEFRGAINEEPIIAIAMALNNIEAIDDKGDGMRTPIGINSALKIDVLQQTCSFNKEGIMVEPAIMHFAGSFADAFHYKREVTKLKMATLLPRVNKRVICFIINAMYNLPYGSLVFFKRLVKMLMRHEKFNFSDTLPVFSNY